MIEKRAPSMHKPLLLLLFFLPSGCQGLPEGFITPGASTPLAPSVAPTITPTRTPTAVIRPIVRSIDLAAFPAARAGKWFADSINLFPETPLDSAASFDIQLAPVDNRRRGRISDTLIAGYLFTEWDLSRDDFDQHEHTIRALFIRSNLMSFVDFLNNRVMMPWNRKTVDIPLDLKGIIGLCNERHIPVFLEINYADYIPGPPGTGIEALRKTDTTADFLDYLRMLKSEGLHIDGITYGDELEDPAGYGELKPTIYNSDFIGRFIDYSKAVKTEFPELKVYGFDSYTFASQGRLSLYWQLLERIHEAEIQANRILLDGFVYRESYVYMSRDGVILDSQSILDDTESLYRDAPVLRYDVPGISHPKTDRDYLHSVIFRTAEIFDRILDLGLTEYLPAGAYEISETDTTRYSDVDFIVHYADTVGIYAELGLDILSTIMFGDSLNQHKAYFDRSGNLGTNYPLHAQFARSFRGDVLVVNRSIEYDSFKVKVYATRQDRAYYIVVLNKDTSRDVPIRLTLSGELELTLRLPARSCTTLTLADGQVIISGIS